MQQYFQHLEKDLHGTALEEWVPHIPKWVRKGLDPKRYGDLPKWRSALEQLPPVQTSSVDLVGSVRIGEPGDTDSDTRLQIEARLRALIPWRKGPFDIHGTHIDTEWRSDWKWDRVLPHIASLEDRLVLDVGCGNGYHCWRMLGAGAKRVIGIEPSPRFIIQFLMTKHFAPSCPVDLLPSTLENIAPPLPVFDSVFSMGVLYHRHSPIDHLRQLKAMLRPGGQLILETLVVHGGERTVLVPGGRYAMMNNVWFLPSPENLLIWLSKVGFRNPRVVDVNQTTVEEQRATDWMTFHSLANFLDPNDPGKTVEGYPAPTRAILVAEND
ncbi:tRNA 5-methoxyuridine(34)/uridine 5-oxyacetic acid(34) synthase CmoB [Gilvimarinus sp. F26214L]|uniref:tRNA 5-methoxyuridine(34)/uridine 5-oxyacetic acid(34) synthase CmoB n=1 Tax=Gilvimarinus sp. DZF01 TaxID=3461371 RepID=UPI0040462DBC